ncbi:23S rRNA (adenine(1618)-N(6))-methyltransferase RlmF [Shewanella sp. NFH-SH190041]|uniref:23S rRNA (adenine(1618)-N(6))-methyltransferase RlmF n=1 Tax=Shewanella sp. NFH-SH190041 TaxID=2950245 RepID=UPI003965B9B9
MNAAHSRPRRATSSQKVHTKTAEKPSLLSTQTFVKTVCRALHPANPHRQGYDFKSLTATLPALTPFVRPNPQGRQSIDWADPQAVKLLNRALLQHYYQIRQWDIPAGFLCPPIPGRADYLHHVADLLPQAVKQSARVLDIGTGANGVYPLVGHKQFGWQFVGSDVDPRSLANLQQIIEANGLQQAIHTRLQRDAKKVFAGIMTPTDRFELTMCNPPFHASLAEASAGSRKKQANLAAANGKTASRGLKLNFGGQKAELWCEGGEIRFLETMIRESRQFANQCLWFSSLVSKSDNIRPCRRLLAKLGAAQVRLIEMHQGNKIIRILVWSFLSTEQQAAWPGADSGVQTY